MFLFFLLSFAFSTWASCLPGAAQHDPLGILLNSACPKDVRELKALLKADGLRMDPAFVGNRGFHNPELGSFSIFETVSGVSQGARKTVQKGQFFFGHFTGLDKGELALDQTPEQGKLLIEVISFDFQKEVFNFYELRGTGTASQWFYRGDSWDAFADNKDFRTGKGAVFGSRMRCSGCHGSGGPIMKELALPHNDWWSKERPLPFGNYGLSSEMKDYLKSFVDADNFAQNVKAGMEFVRKKNLPARLSMKEKLRPLFCTTEINLVSDVLPLESPAAELAISSEVFVDTLLVKPVFLKMKKSSYVMALSALNLHFPETHLKDADHGFLAPVKSFVNHTQVQDLLSQNVIDEEFALDVLAIDFQHPLFSPKRCDLLTLVPESANWREGFHQNLHHSSLAGASELLQNLEAKNGAELRAKASEYVKAKQLSWSQEQGVKNELSSLMVLRKAVFQDDLSKNPRGQILEPGFRIIFPE